MVNGTRKNHEDKKLNERAGRETLCCTNVGSGTCTGYEVYLWVVHAVQEYKYCTVPVQEKEQLLLFSLSDRPCGDDVAGGKPWFDQVDFQRIDMVMLVISVARGSFRAPAQMTVSGPFFPTSCLPTMMMYAL